MYDKNNDVVYIIVLKQALDPKTILKQVGKIIQFNQKPWLRAYIDMNIKLRKETKNDFEKNFRN